MTLICIHPDPRQQPTSNELHQVRVQVKSRYQTDCDRGFPVKEVSLDAFDFLVVAFLNIGKFYNKNDGSTGQEDIEFYTLSNDLIRKYHDKNSSWQKVKLRKVEEDLEQYKNEAGFELIAEKLGVPRPQRVKTT